MIDQEAKTGYTIGIKIEKANMPGSEILTGFLRKNLNAG